MSFSYPIKTLAALGALALSAATLIGCTTAATPEASTENSAAMQTSIAKDPSLDPYAQNNAPTGGGPNANSAKGIAGINPDGYILWVEMDSGEIITTKRNGLDAAPQAAEKKIATEFTIFGSIDVVKTDTSGTVQLDGLSEQAPVSVVILPNITGSTPEEVLQLIEFYNETVMESEAYQTLNQDTLALNPPAANWLYSSLNTYTLLEANSILRENPELTAFTVSGLDEEFSSPEKHQLYTISMADEAQLNELFAQRLDKSLFTVAITAPYGVSVSSEKADAKVVYRDPRDTLPPPLTQVLESTVPKLGNQTHKCVPSVFVNCD